MDVTYIAVVTIGNLRHSCVSGKQSHAIARRGRALGSITYREQRNASKVASSINPAFLRMIVTDIVVK
jgi:hypothetical protein